MPTEVRNTEGFNSLRAGKSIQSVGTRKLGVDAVSFNSLRAGKSIQRLLGVGGTGMHNQTRVSIPFERESLFKGGGCNDHQRGLQVSIPFERESLFKG